MLWRLFKLSDQAHGLGPYLPPLSPNDCCFPPCWLLRSITVRKFNPIYANQSFFLQIWSKRITSPRCSFTHSLQLSFYLLSLPPVSEASCPSSLRLSFCLQHYSPAAFCLLLSFVIPSPALLAPCMFHFTTISPAVLLLPSLGGTLKRAATPRWTKSNMTGATAVAERQMYFLEFTSRNDTLSFPFTLA